MSLAVYHKLEQIFMFCNQIKKKNKHVLEIAKKTEYLTGLDFL
jgi:hypothetical protein